MHLSVSELKRLLAGLLTVLLLLSSAPMALAAADQNLTAREQVTLGEDLGVLPFEAYQSSANASIDGSMYSCLNTRQKACYNALQSIGFNQIMNAVNIDGFRSVSVNISGINNQLLDGYITSGTFYPTTQAAIQARSAIYNDMGAAVIALRYDRPDMLWLEGDIYYGFNLVTTNRNQVRVNSVYYSFDLIYDGKEADMREEMMAEAQTVARTAAAQPDTYNKVRAAHDLLAERSTYNHVTRSEWEENLSHSAYSGLIGGDAYEPVCDGYSKAMKLVCDILGIPCICVTSPTHMWNAVLMDDGLWYNLDLTWDDGGNRPGEYTYLLVGTQSPTTSANMNFEQHDAHRLENPYTNSNITVPATPFPKTQKNAYVYIGKDYPPTTFPDVKRDAWYYEPVEQAAALGIFKGDAQGYFQPTKTITRAEFATAVANMQGVDLNAYKGQESFADVPVERWYAKTAAWALQTGTMQGSGGKFRPNDPITRQEICVVLVNAFELEDGFGVVFPDDEDISGWASEAVYACAALGLVQGDTTGKFNPRNNARRSEAATIFARLAMQET